MRPTLTAQAGMLTIGRSVGQVLSGIAGILVVRSLDRFDYGTYRQIILIFSSLSLFGDAAFAQSLFYFVPRERRRAGTYLSHSALVALVMSAFWTCGLLALSGRIDRFFSNPHLHAHVGLLAGYLLTTLLAGVLEAGLVALVRVSTAALSIGASEVLKFCLILAVLLRSPSINWLLWAMVIATALRVVFLLERLKGELRPVLTSEFIEQFRYSMTLWLPGLLNIAGTYAHQYVVGYYFAPADYALYAVACFQIPFVGVLSTSIGEVLLVRATEWRSHDRHDKIYEVWTNGCRKSLLLFLPMTVAFAVLARPLISVLFTRQYLASAPLFALILMSLPFSGLFQDAILRAYADLRAYSGFYVLRVVLALGFGVLGAKFIGLWGVALSTVLTVAIVNVWQLAKVARLLQITFSKVLPWKDIGKILMIDLTAALPAGAVAHFLTQPLVALVTGLAVFGVVYLLMIERFGLLSKADTASLIEKARVMFTRLSQASARVS